jgi:hypothetical protein
MKCLCQNDYNRLKYFHLTLSKDSIKAPHVAEHRVCRTKKSSVPVWTAWWRHWSAESPPRFPLCHHQVPEAAARRRWAVSARCHAGDVHTARYTTPVQTLPVANSGGWSGNCEHISTTIVSAWRHDDRHIHGEGQVYLI